MMDQTLTDMFNAQAPVNQTQNDSVISIDQLINNTSVQQTTNVVEQTVPQKKKMDKILIIQIVLLVAWAIITTLVYFFGYDLFEPFIKV